MSDLPVAEAEIQDLVYALAPSPNFSRDGICFAARHSGLYRSDDGGLTWRSVYESLNLTETLITTSVALSPDFESDQTVFAGAPGGTLRSTDGGQTWYVTMLPTPPPAITTLAVSPDFTRDGVLLTGTMQDGVFRSADRGGRWTIWNFGLLDLSVLVMTISPGFAQDETLYVGTDSGIFRSTNGGRAWREVNLPIGFEPVLSLALSPTYDQDGILFAGTETKGLFYSADEGESWSQLGEDNLTDSINDIVLSPDYPAAPEILVLLRDDLLVSRDNGRTWSKWQADLTLDEGASTVVAPQGLAPGAPLLIGSAEGGVLRV